MRFLSNFGCKLIFMCSVNFWHQQYSNSLFEGSIGYVTSQCKWPIKDGGSTSRQLISCARRKKLRPHGRLNTSLPCNVIFPHVCQNVSLVWKIPPQYVEFICERFCSTLGGWGPFLFSRSNSPFTKAVLFAFQNEVSIMVSIILQII